MLHSIKAVFICLILISNSSFAQNSVKKEANRFFEAKKYEQALKSYNNYDKITSSAELLIKRGVCSYFLNQPNDCINDMIQADKLKSTSLCRFKYTALSYMALQDYKEAASNFKLYLKVLKPNEPEYANTILNIKRCGLANNLKYINQAAYVENLGVNVNTKFDEFAPIQSPTKPERYYFSSARETSTGGLRNDKGISDILYGQYSSDMYLVDLLDGNWSNVLTFEPLLNSPKHDILQDFSPDGSIIYFLKSSDIKTGILYSDTFSLDRDASRLPIRAEIPFNAEVGDKDLFVFSDSLILFSSQMEGGFGGYDLFYSVKNLDSWSEPINFGASINTIYNESSPFLTKGGLKLFFASDRLEGFGGNDIFSVDYEENVGWNSVTNLGLGINSPANDIHIEVSADGLSALLASNRIESFGGYDIYLAYFKDQIMDQLGYVEVPPFAGHEDAGSDISNVIVTSNIQPDITYPSRDFLNQALYFKDNDDVLNTTNLVVIKKLADLLIIYPETKILLTSHFLTEGRTDLDLYFSIKRAEKVADKLINLGISPHRILMQGCGANYPIALPTINGLPSSLANKTNKRIDIEVLEIEGLNLNINTEFPIVAEQYRDAAWDKYMSDNSKITYRVKFAKVSQMLKSDLVDHNKDVNIEKKASESTYTYTIGNFVNLNDAISLSHSLVKENAPNYTVRPYLNGVEIDDSKIPTLLTTYPSLVEFISSNK